MIRSRTTKRTSSQAFTLVELIVSIAIFGIMTALVVAKYGTFNNSVLLTNAAYDVAGAIRTAQTYGLSVKNDSSNDYSKVYSIGFSTQFLSNNLCQEPNPLLFMMYTNPDLDLADGSNAGVDTLYQCDSIILGNYSFRNGAKVNNLSITLRNGLVYNDITNLTVSFRRPDPDAYLYFFVISEVCYEENPENANCFVGETYNQNDVISAKINISSADGLDSRNINIYKNGQISVDN